MCHAIAAQHSVQHADLAAASMMVSDDHCWLSLPQQQQQQQAGHAATSSTGSDDVQQLVNVEVTDPRPLKAADMANWLYAGTSGSRPCSPHQVIMILVAGLMPEELKDEAAAAQLAAVQMALLGNLAAAHPAALFYSNFFRWGMLHEEQELRQLVAAAEAGTPGELQRLALLRADQLQSQCCYAESVRRSSGMQWHPHSCAAFGWLNRMQAALCGDTDELLLLSSSWRVQAAASRAVGSTAAASASDKVQSTPGAGTAVGAAFWLGLATHLFEQALAAVGGCTAVLRQYTGAAGKPDKSADKQLMEAVRDLWANLADACKAMAALQQLADTEQQQQQHSSRCGVKGGGHCLSSSAT
ncbi:hypothetical protein COO60DRAFT_1036222 [Scenedesmus sp. NREL 46B-D3]|nr:hypothetical protein COO60DRAFT_1036222 [Scenedesmus sp. NREL 46B-D3]